MEFNTVADIDRRVNLMEQHGGCQFWPQSDKPVERFNVSARRPDPLSSLIRLSFPTGSMG